MVNYNTFNPSFGRSNIDNANINCIKRKFLDIYYGSLKSQKLDIYLPSEGNGPFPVIIFFHGGAFFAGDKRDYQVRPFLEGINKGYAVVSANYRLSMEAKYPEPLFDVKSAIRWVKNNALRYGLEPNKIALSGDSAGGYFAVMAAATQDRPEFEGLNLAENANSRVQAVVDWFGPTDFLLMNEHFEQSGIETISPCIKGKLTPEELFLGASLKKISGLSRFSNPINYVSTSIPPMLIQHGRLDPVVPYQQSIILAKAIEKVAGKGRVILDIKEEYFHVDERFETEENMNYVFDFIDGIIK